MKNRPSGMLVGMHGHGRELLCWENLPCLLGIMLGKKKGPRNLSPLSP